MQIEREDTKGNFQGRTTKPMSVRHAQFVKEQRDYIEWHQEIIGKPVFLEALHGTYGYL